MHCKYNALLLRAAYVMLYNPILSLKVQMKINLFAIFIKRTQLLTWSKFISWNWLNFCAYLDQQGKLRDSLRGAFLLKTIIIPKDELPLIDWALTARHTGCAKSFADMTGRCRKWDICLFLHIFLYLLKFNYETKLVFPFLDCQTPLTPLL